MSKVSFSKLPHNLLLKIRTKKKSNCLMNALKQWTKTKVSFPYGKQRTIPFTRKPTSGALLSQTSINYILGKARHRNSHFKTVWLFGMVLSKKKRKEEFLSEAVNASLFLMTIWDGTFQKEEERPTNKYMTSRKYTSDNWCGNSWNTL